VVNVNHLHLVGTNHISRKTEAGVIKFCTPVGYIKSQHTEDESPTKGAWSGSRDPLFHFDSRNHISGTTEATVAKFCMQVEYIKCLTFDDRLLSNGREVKTYGKDVFITLAESSVKRNVTVWRPSVCLSLVYSLPPIVFRVLNSWWGVCLAEQSEDTEILPSLLHFSGANLPP